MPRVTAGWAGATIGGLCVAAIAWFAAAAVDSDGAAPTPEPSPANETRHGASIPTLGPAKGIPTMAEQPPAESEVADSASAPAPSFEYEESPAAPESTPPASGGEEGGSGRGGTIVVPGGYTG